MRVLIFIGATFVVPSLLLTYVFDQSDIDWVTTSILLSPVALISLTLGAFAMLFSRYGGYAGALVTTASYLAIVAYFLDGAG